MIDDMLRWLKDYTHLLKNDGFRSIKDCLAKSTVSGREVEGRSEVSIKSCIGEVVLSVGITLLIAGVLYRLMVLIWR